MLVLVLVFVVLVFVLVLVLVPVLVLVLVLVLVRVLVRVLVEPAARITPWLMARASQPAHAWGLGFALCPEVNWLMLWPSLV